MSGPQDQIEAHLLDIQYLRIGFHVLSSDIFNSIYCGFQDWDPCMSKQAEEFH